ncbi:MAG TPA: hypothetical protein VMG40_18985 [Bryobacteraceae bacterium]|nr:hypothetical protein [Bryobacteraceae bacterium]
MRFNLTCEKHGVVWHREMVRDGDGKLCLHFPLDPDGPLYAKGDGPV